MAVALRREALTKSTRRLSQAPSSSPMAIAFTESLLPRRVASCRTTAEACANCWALKPQI